MAIFYFKKRYYQWHNSHNEANSELFGMQTKVTSDDSCSN